MIEARLAAFLVLIGSIAAGLGIGMMIQSSESAANGGFVLGLGGGVAMVGLAFRERQPPS